MTTQLDHHVAQNITRAGLLEPSNVQWHAYLLPLQWRRTVIPSQALERKCPR